MKPFSRREMKTPRCNNCHCKHWPWSVVSVRLGKFLSDAVTRRVVHIIVSLSIHQTTDYRV